MPAAAGATARRRLRAVVASPHQPVLLVVAEVLRVAVGAALPARLAHGGGFSLDVAGRVVATGLIEELPALSTAALPRAALFHRAQVVVVAVGQIGQTGAAAGGQGELAYERIDGVGERGQIVVLRAVAAHARQRSQRGIVDLGEGVAGSGGTRGTGLRLFRLVGIGVVLCQLVGRQRLRHVPTAGQAEGRAARW